MTRACVLKPIRVIAAGAILASVGTVTRANVATAMIASAAGVTHANAAMATRVSASLVTHANVAGRRTHASAEAPHRVNATTIAIRIAPAISGIPQARGIHRSTSMTCSS